MVDPTGYGFARETNSLEPAVFERTRRQLGAMTVVEHVDGIQYRVASGMTPRMHVSRRQLVGLCSGGTEGSEANTHVWLTQRLGRS